MNFDWLFEAPVAHRGLHDDKYPENSMPAFEQAVKEGFNIEIDVHVTTDNRVVVFHDDNLKRVCGVDKLVKDCSLAQLQAMKLCGTEYSMPTFEEFLALVDGKVGILCEIKGILPWDRSIPKATIEVLNKVGYKGNIALQSFNFGAVIYSRKHSSLPVGQLCTWGDGRSVPLNVMGKLHLLAISKPHFVAYDIRALDKKYPENKYVKKWIKKLPFLMWTVNSPERLDAALANANNIIFENMDLNLVRNRFAERRPLLQNK
jgi:glycerophosphoryl diester phosphodiesterase